MEEDGKEMHESQPEPEDEGKEERPEPETQPVPESEAKEEQSAPEMEPQPAPASSPRQPPSATKERRQQFLLGLGIGFIPLVLFFIGFVPNAIGLIIVSLILLVVVLIASLICLAIPRVRYVGYGLLTSIPISLVVGSIGCIVILSRPPSG
jgi:hypothetical protein